MTTAELSKVESIAEQLYGPSPSQEITQYCEQMKNFYLSNLNSFQDLFNSYIKTANSHFAFWLLDVLITLTNTQYNNLSPQLKETFRNYYYSKEETQSIDIEKYSSITLEATPILYLDDNIYITYDHLKRSSIFNLSTKGNPEDFLLGELY